VPNRLRPTPHPIDEALLSAYYDGAVDDVERRRVAVHLTRCAACRARLDDYAALRQALLTEPAAPRPVSLLRRLGQLRRSDPPRAAARRRGGSGWLGWTSGTFRTALATLVLVALWVATFGTTMAPSAIGGRGGSIARPPQAQPRATATLETVPSPVSAAARPAPAAVVGGQPRPSPTVTGPASLPRPVRPAPGLPASPARLVTVGPPANPTAAIGTPSDLVDDPAADPTPSPSATRAALTVAVVPVATAPSHCTIQPVHGFGSVYTSDPAVAARLGCATDPEVGVPGDVETFEHGVMLWRGDTHQIYVLENNGTWAVFPDTYQDGQALADVGVVPAGQYAPARGFGLLWRTRPAVRQGLGWATAPEQGEAGAVQPFAKGLMYWANGYPVYILFADGTWRSLIPVGP
jgi:hypothetical protein